MGLHSDYNLKYLLSNWPYGSVRTFCALELQGFYRQLTHKYVKSGWLVHYGYGAYARFGDPVDWLGGIYGLQEGGLDIYLGGRTALELQGASHFLPMAKELEVHLYTQTVMQLPKWIVQHSWNAKLKLFKIKLFPKASLGLIDYPWRGFSIKISSPERAVMELLNEVSDEESFTQANYFMEGLGTLRSQLVQELLENCNSIKVKRIFLFLANYNDHLWLKDIDYSKIPLGSGCRSVIKGGRFDKKHLITVPQSFVKLKIEDVP